MERVLKQNASLSPLEERSGITQINRINQTEFPIKGFSDVIRELVCID